MKKTVVAALVSMAFGANAANMDDLRISGFGSVGIGKSDNAIGYAGYTDENQIGSKRHQQAYNLIFK